MWLFDLRQLWHYCHNSCNMDDKFLLFANLLLTIDARPANIWHVSTHSTSFNLHFKIKYKNSFDRTPPAKHEV